PPGRTPLFQRLQGDRHDPRGPCDTSAVVLYSLPYVVVRFLLETLIVRGQSEARPRAGPPPENCSKRCAGLSRRALSYRRTGVPDFSMRLVPYPVDLADASASKPSWSASPIAGAARLVHLREQPRQCSPGRSRRLWARGAGAAVGQLPAA